MLTSGGTGAVAHPVSIHQPQVPLDGHGLGGWGGADSVCRDIYMIPIRPYFRLVFWQSWLVVKQEVEDE